MKEIKEKLLEFLDGKQCSIRTNNLVWTPNYNDFPIFLKRNDSYFTIWGSIKFINEYYYKSGLEFQSLL